MIEITKLQEQHVKCAKDTGENKKKIMIDGHHFSINNITNYDNNL